jgi:two-component system OmpR family response regulator
MLDHTDTILFIEDDVGFAAELITYLSAHGMNKIEHLNEAPEINHIISRDPDLVIVDQFVGDVDFLSFITQISNSIRGSVVMLTGNDDLVDRVVCLESGAVDYINKLTPPREILARLRVALRWRNKQEPPTTSVPAPPVKSAYWTIDTGRRLVQDSAGTDIQLSGLEYETFLLLHQNTGNIVPREQISRTILQREFHSFDRSIDNIISRIRARLELHGINRGVIRNVRNRGYALVPPKAPET